MKKRVVSLLLAGLMVVSSLAMTGCGEKKTSKGGDTFSYWIFTTDGEGTYYEKYEDNPAVQWLNQQYWDVENHTLGDKDNGENIKFTFVAPIAGSEGDNFNTMVSTGEYTDIMDLCQAGSKDALVEDGVLMDITEYVEKYMPDYVALLDEHPDWKAMVTSEDEDGNTKYYYLAIIKDGPPETWDCYEYRRDWVVKYATPTEYVWDWDSDYVKENGHPAVTPLSEAQKAGNLEGWKKNEVTKFTSSEGDDPNEDYTDNVIFPSGKSDPYTISDWEWMLEAFDKAIADRGWSDDADSYGTSVPYNGYSQLGDLVSSFGGGTGYYYVDKNGKVSYDGTSDNFKAYLECLSNWYNKGWLDERFETRSGDMFFSINQTGCTQGKVGMWLGTTGTLGTTIRPSCMNAEDQADAYIMGCALPINDVYGGDEQKFKEPDALYQSAAGPDGGIGITTKAEGKNLEALFTYFNWCYTKEGATFSSFGLTKEQYESVELDNDLYEKYGFTDGLYHLEDRDGVETVVLHLDPNSGLNINAFKTCRMIQRYEMTGHGDVDYAVDTGDSKVIQDAKNAYGQYVNTGSILPYMDMMTDEEKTSTDKINTPMGDYVNMTIPKLIKNDLKGWDEYVSKIDAYGPDEVCKVFQQYVDKANGK